jgi:hypothetical protein
LILFLFRIPKALRVIQASGNQLSMDMGSFNLFIKMIRDQYALNDSEVQVLTNRMLADDKEFEKVWKLYKNRAGRLSGGVDQFKILLQDLLT